MKKMMSTAAVLVALAGTMMFTSCGKNDLYDANLVNEKTVKSYEQQFVEAFGPVSETQSWDFTASAKASTRGEADDAPVLIEQFKDATYGLEWKWKDSQSKANLNQNALNTIYNNDLEDIKSAVADTDAQPWNIDQYSNILFRVFATSPCDNTKTYMRVGLHLDAEKNWWVAQTNPKLKWHKGTNYMDHPRYMDLTQLPEDAFWFVIAQSYTEAQTNRQGALVKASDYKLTTFKEVVVNGNTFWCFDCNRDGNYEDMIWWVEATKKPVEEPVVVVSEVAKRYMMEDLGSVGDFDFNDCVVDLTQTTWSDGKVETKGVVRALGGKLDIAILIGGKQVWAKSAQEGLDVKTMYNTTNINKSNVYGEFDASDWQPSDNNISFAVKGENAQDITTMIEFPKTGTIPQMVAVKADHDWMTERTRVPNISWFK